METISKEVAFGKGYLKNKTVYLKPIVRGGRMVSDPAHVAYFQYEGSSNWFQLPLNDKGNMVNPFDSEEEKNFFEKVLDLDLGIHGKGNFWEKFFVKVIKDFALMHNGYEFDLSDPMEVLRYKVTTKQEFVAPNWESRYNRPEYRFALVDEDYEIQAEADASSELIEAYTYFGAIKSSTPKMRDFLGIYFNETKQLKFVPEDSDKVWLQKEIKKIIDDDIKNVLKVINDKDAPIKKFILDGIRASSISKDGRNKYTISGEGVSQNLEELVTYLKKAEEVSDDIYLKISAQIKLNEKTK